MLNKEVKIENNYGFILKLFRIANNMEISYVAQQFGESDEYISKIESMNIVNDDILENFCKVYNVTLEIFHKIHNISRNRYEFGYQKTLKDIVEYYIAKKYFCEDY